MEADPMGRSSRPLSIALPLTRQFASELGKWLQLRQAEGLLSPLTFGLPALLVTSLRSFTVPCALQMPSSSSLVQEKGRPEMKSLCFSRVVLYLNTYKTGKAHGGWSGHT